MLNKKLPVLRLLLALAASILLSGPVFAAAARTVAQAPAGRQFAAGGLNLVLVPQTGQLFRLNPDATATRLRASYIYEDSKAAAFHLDRGHVLKLYTGPGYQNGSWKMEQAKINQMGQREAAIMNGWAQAGLALPVTEQGQTSEGVFYAVVEKPKRSVSGTYLVKKGRAKELAAKMEALAAALAERRWLLGTLNPTQVVVERGGRSRALLVKSYSYDRVEKGKGEQELRGYYDAQAAEFQTLSDIYGALKNNGPPLSDGSLTTDPAAIRRLVIEGFRQGRELRVVHKKSDKDRAKMFHLRVLPSSFRGRDNHFLKGYIHALVFPENGKTYEYTFRLDRVLEAEFLASSRPAYSAQDYNAALTKVAVMKGRKGYPAARQGALAFLREAGAPDADIARFKAEVKALKPNALPEKPKTGFTDEQILAAARSVVSWKQGPSASFTEYNAAYAMANYQLAEGGATLRQLSLFLRTVEEAPAAFSTNGGGT